MVINQAIFRSYFMALIRWAQLNIFDALLSDAQLFNC
jgi:hypothetical protein